MRHGIHTAGTVTLRRWRAYDYAALTKPGLTLLSVVTAAGGAFLASATGFHYQIILHASVGTALAGGGAGALNQYFEKTHDSFMKRTRNRPLASGRINEREALFFGIALVSLGVGYLWVFANTAAAALACLTLGSYLFLYTPLKRVTPFATIVGGVSGALPPLIGWSAVRGGVSIDGWTLFFILFFWQTPHFLSLAWMYREDYRRAGYKVLTVVDPTGRVTSRQILVYAAALIPAAIMPTIVGISGIIYFFGALLVSVLFLMLAIRLFTERSNQVARRLFFASLTYLPVLFFLMVIDRYFCMPV